MNDNEPNANGQRNSEFIKNIKDKYTSARGGKASNNYGVSSSSGLYPERSQHHQRTNSSVLQSKQAVLNARAGSNGDNYSRLERNYVNLGEYQTFRGQERQARQGYFKESDYKEEGQKREGINPDQDSTNKSSPIKKFYESSKNAENYLIQRKSEIEEIHRQRAIQHRIEREKNERTVADIDFLLQSIRAALAQHQFKR